jgi:hypothetical protein
LRMPNKTRRVIAGLSSRMDNKWTIGASHVPNGTRKHRRFNDEISKLGLREITANTVFCWLT